MTKPDTPFLEFFYFDAGGGHRSAALALREVMAERFPGWRIELVNLQELLSPIDPVALLTEKMKSKKKVSSGKKFQSEDIYNGMLKRGWTYGFFMLLRGLQNRIRALTPEMEDLVHQHWQEECPDLVVSLIPNFNRVMFRALRRDHPHVPYVTIMTDIADYPPHFWQERQDQFIVCGSKKALRQARTIGYRPERIFEVSGMILRPDFYRTKAMDRRAARIKLGLDPDLPTALIMFGGHGSKISMKIVKHMEQADTKMQSIVMCGHHEKLRVKLSKHTSCHAVGFVDDVPHYMRLADFFIGKPGPGSISEALHMGLPVILERNQATMPQERYNTKWVERHKLGVVVRRFTQKETLRAIGFLLKDDTLEQFRENARYLNNRAVFEIAEILEKIFASASPFTLSADEAGYASNDFYTNDSAHLSDVRRLARP
jgi:1,2-diacylglycerol 3-beta-galactosyltransferase